MRSNYEISSLTPKKLKRSFETTNPSPMGLPDVNPYDFTHTLGEIIISPLAHPNVNGMPYASAVSYDHSSDLRTWEEVFGLSPLLRHANAANDLPDLLAAGAIPSQP